MRRTTTTRERLLDARRRAAEREPDPEQGAGNDDPARRVGEHHQVPARPAQEGDRVQMEMEDRVVVPEHMAEPGEAEPEQWDQEGGDRQQLLAQRGADAPLADAEHEGGEDEHDRQDDELRPREHGERGEDDEGDLRAPARLREGDRRRGHGRHDQWVGERLGRDERRVEEVRNEERESRQSEGDPARQAEPHREHVHGDGGERHRERTDRLDDAEPRVDVTEQPGRCGEDRLEKRREVCRPAADRRPAGLSERTPDRGVDVLVREECGCRAEPADAGPDEKARPHECRERVGGVALHTSLLGTTARWL